MPTGREKTGDRKICGTFCESKISQCLVEDIRVSNWGLSKFWFQPGFSYHTHESQPVSSQLMGIVYQLSYFKCVILKTIMSNQDLNIAY